MPIYFPAFFKDSYRLCSIKRQLPKIYLKMIAVTKVKKKMAVRNNNTYVEYNVAKEIVKG